MVSHRVIDIGCFETNETHISYVAGATVCHWCHQLPQNCVTASLPAPVKTPIKRLMFEQRGGTAVTIMCLS